MRNLMFDWEVLPGTAYFWRTGQQFVSLDMMVTSPRAACFAARFEGEKKVHFYSEWDHGQHDMAVGMRDLLDEADVVTHFNGKTFDMPWSRTVIQLAGLSLPSPVKQIDLYQQTKPFALVSHKLQHVSSYLVPAEGKVPTGGFGLWKAVMAGDAKARAHFKKYNIQDVNVLERVYQDLKPWLKVPNAQLYGAPHGSCSTCGSQNLQSRGVETTLQSTYRRLYCNDCGSWSRSTARLVGADNVKVVP